MPRGSLCHLMFTEENSPSTTGALSASSIRLTGVVLNNEIRRVSALAVRIEVPSRQMTGGSSPANAPAPQLPAGTRVTFRLTEPLVVPQR
ncbi:MAG: hypothetical protein HYS33_05400 [Acidobacteria bacterium]|nr:hypothetical protein [Acidobacteriota bacterium]